MINFNKLLNSGPVLFDSSMNTELFSRGVQPIDVFEVQNIENPNLVREVHRDYISAGVQVITANTFEANSVKLEKHGLADQVKTINTTGVRLAKQEAGNDVLVAGTVGPCSSSVQTWETLDPESVKGVFSEQINSLVEAGCDLLLLKSFSYDQELKTALDIAEKSGLPLVVCVTSNLKDSETDLANLSNLLQTLDAEESVVMSGMNCGPGLDHFFDLAGKLINEVKKPFLVMPNAGRSRQENSGSLFMSNPDYFRNHIARLFTLGCRGVGGCCGFTTEYIREAKLLIDAEKRLEMSRLSVKKDLRTVADKDEIPANKRSELGRLLSLGQKVKTVELIPPIDITLRGFMQKAQACKEAGVNVINIPDGPRASARIAAMITAITIQKELDIETILHLTCRDRNIIALQSDLLGAYASGLRNILALTGDPPKLGNYPDATGVFDTGAVGLTSLIKGLNKGQDLAGSELKGNSSFLVGVAANPCALSMEKELEHLANKVMAGADFVMTQPVFDSRALLNFLDKANLTIPVIAGVWPLYSYKNAVFLQNEVPGVEVPKAIMKRMESAKSKEESINCGITIAHEIKAEISNAVAGFQVSAPFGKVQIAFDVLAD